MMEYGLSVWVKDPRIYKDMRLQLTLPSESVLRRQKNLVPQKSGINQDNFDWMLQAAKEQGLHGNVTGGILFDEMSIQPALSIGKDDELIGYVRTGVEHEYIYQAQYGHNDSRLANYVLQFIFNTFRAFRWPLSHYPTHGALAPELSEILWDNIRELMVRGFVVIYLCFDGAAANRNFIHMICQNSRMPSPFTIANILQPTELIAVMNDPKHVIKNIRNGMLNSGTHNSSTRRLIYKSDFIEWSQIIKIYHWDKHTHAFPIYYNLTEQHIFPNTADKMRNKLAEDVINGDFLNLEDQLRHLA